MSELVELRERIRAAQHGDRDLDRAVYEIVKMGHTKPSDYTVIAGPYTASIDAALGLVERLLPGWNFSLHMDDVTTWEATITPPDWRDLGDFRAGDAFGVTAPLAILDALLSALIAKQETP